MRSKQVFIELLPSRADVTVMSGGRRVGAERLALELPVDVADWNRELRHNIAELRGIVERLEATGAPTFVLYRSPSHSSDHSGYPLKAAEAREAARLECLSNLTYAANIAVCQSVLVGRDADKSHVVVAADREDITETIASFVNEAGLKFISATPVAAATMARLIKAILQSNEPNDAWLYLGEHSSFFLVTDGGNLAFAREMRIGLDAMATSLTRPLRVEHGQEPIELDPKTARRILHQFGRPIHNEIIDEELGLRGDRIIPLMQPVLQRFIIEMRQSLRFGLSAEQRQRLKIRLIGPGSTVPNLAQLASEELEVEVSTSDDAAAYDWSMPGSPGSELIEATGDAKFLGQLNLQPSILARMRSGQQLRRWLWTGAATAMLIIGFDAVRVGARLSDVRKESEAIATQSAGQEQLAATQQRLMGMVNAMSALESDIDAAIGARPDFGAVLRELSRLTPEYVRLKSISINRQDNSATGTISGFAIGNGEHAPLESFIAALHASPLFDDVTLGNVQMSDEEGAGGRREQFDANVVLVLTPRPERLQSIVVAPTEPTP